MRRPRRIAAQLAAFRRLGSAAWKLILLGPGGWRLLWQAQRAILQAAALVRERPRGELIRELEEIAAAPLDAVRPADAGHVEAIGLAIDRIARLGFGRPRCLVRSLALQQLLQRNGIAGSVIRVGVRMRRGTFEAHAWVEWNGTIVGEDPAYVEKFRAFSGIQTRRVEKPLMEPS